MHMFARRQFRDNQVNVPNPSESSVEKEHSTKSRGEDVMRHNVLQLTLAVVTTMRDFSSLSALSSVLGTTGKSSLPADIMS